MSNSIKYTSQEKNILSHCCLCPRNCGVNRLNGQLGYCNLNSHIAIASICNHKGEEPIISGTKGICNVFFSHCNLQCIYCQNHQISCNSNNPNYVNIDDVVQKIKDVLRESNNVLGFVSSTSQVPQMRAIIRLLQEQGVKPIIVYNTNSYDQVDVLKQLEDIVDVYLADMRYAFDDVAQRLSDVKDYPQRATAALKEMYRQKGSSLLTNANDEIEKGLIIRVLCLPQMKQNTLHILDLIADNLSPNVHISLLSQYYPPFVMPEACLNQCLSQKEYDIIVDYALKLGFTKIQTQELSSADNLQPDFNKNIPF
ncbi:MAG: radical SAM protein [Bacteroidales bacterium]|jgi:putative pyruvate formate lyase activating enzyme|nr:radical SAM protein [Bacteroidales bacterium]